MEISTYDVDGESDKNNACEMIYLSILVTITESMIPETNLSHASPVSSTLLILLVKECLKKISIKLKL